MRVPSCRFRKFAPAIIRAASGTRMRMVLRTTAGVRRRRAGGLGGQAVATRRGKKERVDLWLKDAAPSPELRVFFDHRAERFEEFAVAYRAELAGNSAVTSSVRWPGSRMWRALRRQGPGHQPCGGPAGGDPGGSSRRPLAICRPWLRNPSTNSPPRPRHAVVTGASSGIGAATVRKLRADGWHVVAVARRADRLEELAAETGALAFAADVTSDDDVADLAAFVADGTAGSDTLVNIAGGARGADPMATAVNDDWEWMFQVNVLGTMKMVRAFLPALRAHGHGTILNLTSSAGLAAYEGGGRLQRRQVRPARPDRRAEARRGRAQRPGDRGGPGPGLHRRVRAEPPGGDPDAAAKVYDGSRSRSPPRTSPTWCATPSRAAPRQPGRDSGPPGGPGRQLQGDPQTVRKNAPQRCRSSTFTVGMWKAEPSTESNGTIGREEYTAPPPAPSLERLIRCGSSAPSPSASSRLSKAGESSWTARSPTPLSRTSRRRGATSP